MIDYLTYVGLKQQRREAFVDFGAISLISLFFFIIASIFARHLTEENVFWAIALFCTASFCLGVATSIAWQIRKINQEMAHR